jgi:oxygen-independent coproporphyrinogen-3 oxidase
MSPGSLTQVMGAARDSFTLIPEAEISLEANPGTVDVSYLAQLRALGINRISFGVQSAVPEELALLEREHDYAAVIEAVGMSRAAGFTNLNLDLIYGVPGQTLATWQESLLAALALNPNHFSLYCLTIEPGTPMQRWLNSGRIQLPDPDLAADQYELAGELLLEHGFCHYEISNWALPGHECQHNLTYWRNQAYLGMGAGAHGHAAGYRYSVVKQPRVYIRRMQDSVPTPYPFSLALASKHLVGTAEAISDTVITQLRLLQEGLDLEAFEAKFGQTLDEAYPGLLTQLRAWGLLAASNGRLRLTTRGRFLSNQVFYRFL